MAIMDFLGRAAGVGAYGGVVGRSAVQNGIELGRALYLGHGISAESSGGGVLICEDIEEMRAKGFAPYCSDTLTMPATEDRSQLSIHCRVAAIALASKLATGAAAACFSNPARNNQEFCLALWGGIRQGVTDLHSELNFGLVETYLRLGGGDTKVVTPALPGSNDIFGMHLAEVAKHASSKAVAFQRSGPLGFGKIVLDLVQDTIQKIHEASVKYRW
jgi:hypothetical protein